MVEIKLEKWLDEKYPARQRAEIKELKIRPRNFAEFIQRGGFLDLREFTNLEYLLLENVPQMRGWNLTQNSKLKRITFSNSSFYQRWWRTCGEPEVEGFSLCGSPEVLQPEDFPGGHYFTNPENAYQSYRHLELTFPNNPELVKESVEILGNPLNGVIFNLPTQKEKELQKQLETKQWEVSWLQERLKDYIGNEGYEALIEGNYPAKFRNQ